MPRTESVLVTWTLESNEVGTWALFVRVSGVATQMTPWFTTQAEALAVFVKAAV